jgi:hypothetical protein
MRPRGTCGSIPRRPCSTRGARGARWWRPRRPPARWGSLVKRLAARDPPGGGSASGQARGAGDGGVTRGSARAGPLRAPPGGRARGAPRRDHGPGQGRRPASRGPPARASAPPGPRAGARRRRALSAGARGVASRRTATLTARSIPTSPGARGAQGAPGGRASAAVGAGRSSHAGARPAGWQPASRGGRPGAARWCGHHRSGHPWRWEGGGGRAAPVRRA